MTGSKTDNELLKEARGGDKSAFEALCQGTTPQLRAVIRRLLGHPDQVSDIVTATVEKGFETLAAFEGNTGFSAWLTKIGVGQAVALLKQEKPWREKAQIAHANECRSSADAGMEVGLVMMSPSFQFEANEHIAFCFTCVGRSLDPDVHATLVLKEAQGLPSKDGAQILDVTEAEFRNRLAEGRNILERTFDGLCGLMKKENPCHQCEALREAVPDSDRRGRPAPQSLNLEQRLKIVRETDIDAGKAQKVHDVSWKRIHKLEQDGKGSTEV